MEITFFGIICFVILAILTFLPIRYTVATLIISTMFQSAAVINLSDKGISPLVLLEVYLFCRFLIMRKTSKKDSIDIDNKKLATRLFLFFIVSILVSLLSALMFENLNIQNVYENRNPIIIGLNSNLIVKIILLFFNISSVYIVYKLKHLYSNEFIKKVCIITIGLVLFFGFWEYLWKITNRAFYYPADILYNNVGYTQGLEQAFSEADSSFIVTKVRLNSTFLEASYCGAFLVPSLYALIAINEKGKYTKMILLLILAIIFNLSGTGLITLVLGAVYYTFNNGKRKINLATIVKIIIAFAIMLLVLQCTGYLERIIDMVANKMSSISGKGRSYANEKGLEICAKTYLIGGGLGCYRASSFICALLATVGIPGTGLLIYTFAQYLHATKLQMFNNTYLKFGYFYFITLLIGMALSVPDITFSPLWFILIYMVSIKNVQEGEQSFEN